MAGREAAVLQDDGAQTEARERPKRQRLQPARYEAAHDGRGSGKSHFFASIGVKRCMRCTSRIKTIEVGCASETTGVHCGARGGRIAAGGASPTTDSLPQRQLAESDKSMSAFRRGLS
jgi:hypothetical protein